MSKSYVDELLGVYESVFRDISYAHPSLLSELDKDQLRLTRLVRERGLPFLTVDLPALGKHLDRCLSEGTYKVSGLPGSSRVSGTVPIPKFLRGLYLRIFESDGRLKEVPDVEAIFFVRQVLYLAKELPIQCSQDAVRTEVRTFFETDRLLPSPGDFWSQGDVKDEECQATYQGFAQDTWYSSRLNTSSADENLLVMLDHVSSVISTTLGFYKPEEWNFKHGPGVVSNRKTGENRYRFVSWPDRLESAYPISDCGFHNYTSWAANTSVGDLICSDEQIGKLIDVPKTFTKPRLISAEPSEHMWCQQNIWHFMKTRVEKSWIGEFVKFNDQTYNQNLCIRGSTDGSLATIDLSAASDRVSCRCVGQFFRANLRLLLGFRATRTRFIRQLQLSDEAEVVELNKYSTMGNATTFPVETLIFLGIALTACLVTDGVKTLTIKRLEEYIGQVSVFGDDIIVPRECVGTLIRLLEVLDFKVNLGKSYSDGKFRESCGIDCFAGQAITPAKYHGPYKGTPESYASIVSVSNNFYLRFLVNTSNYLQSTIERFRTPLVPMDSGYLGRKSFVRPTECHLRSFRSRWNSDLQKTEWLVPCVSARSSKHPIQDDSALLQFFTEQPDPHVMWESGVASRPKLIIRLRWVGIDSLHRHIDLCREEGAFSHLASFLT